MYLETRQTSMMESFKSLFKSRRCLTGSSKYASDVRRAYSFSFPFPHASILEPQIPLPVSFRMFYFAFCVNLTLSFFYIFS